MKKKWLFLCLVLCLFSLSISAQVKFGVEAGMNLSHFKYTKSYAEKIGNMKPGFQIGATVGYEFPKHWTLMSGVSFMQTHSNMKLTDFFPNTEIKLNHLMIPLKVGYNIQLNDKFSLVPSIGVYGSYDFSAGSSTLDYFHKDGIRQDTWKPTKGYSYEYPDDFTESPVPYFASIEACRKWTYGGIAEVKAVIAKHYTVSFSYYESIKKTIKYNGLRNYSLQLSVGYQF